VLYVVTMPGDPRFPATPGHGDSEPGWDAEQQHDFALAFATAAEAVVVTDDDRGIVDANPAACRLLGVARAALVGRRLDDFTPAAGRPALEARWEALLRDGRQAGSWKVLRADGEVVVATYSAKAHFQPGYHLARLGGQGR
jgi:PAS domain S-box-containing protein